MTRTNGGSSKWLPAFFSVTEKSKFVNSLNDKHDYMYEGVSIKNVIYATPSKAFYLDFRII